MTPRVLHVACLLASGCLTIPDTTAPQCYSTSDCDTSAGEVCADGVCYGNPPTGTFAIAVGAPSARLDLIGIERATEDLPDYGFLADLTLEAPVTLSGRVSAASCVSTALAECPTGALGASITISRPARFAGGPGVHEVAQSTAGGADTSFTVPVPRTRPSDADYTITVVPNDVTTGDPSVAAAELVPPLRTTLRTTDNLQAPFALGGDTLPVITGDLLGPDSTALTDYRVAAVGQWSADEAPSEVSSVAYSHDGHFQIMLSADLVGPVEIVARPTGMGAVAPTLHLGGIDSATGSALAIQQPANLGAPHIATLTIRGTSTGGAVGPISGARVLATATVTMTTALPMTGSPAAAELTAEVTTGDDGIAQLPLLDGTAFAGGYHLRVVPPAGSNLAVLDEDAFLLADATRVLKPRVALQGTVVDADGKPVRDVSVTVRPSLRFTWSLADASQLFLAQIPAATAVTPDTGDFVVFVDPALDAVTGTYDVTLEPPSGSSVPSFTVTDVAIPAGAKGPDIVALGTITLPDAASLHGRISDPGGNSVEGAELRVFRLPADQLLCTQVTNAPKKCQVPAQLQAHATSDQDGLVRFILPRPAMMP